MGQGLFKFNLSISQIKCEQALVPRGGTFPVTIDLPLLPILRVGTMWLHNRRHASGGRA